MHRFTVENRINRWVNHIIKRKHIPPIIPCRRLPQLHIQPIQELRFMILRIGRPHRSVYNRHQIMLVQLGSRIREFGGNQIHQVLKEVPLPKKKVALDGEHVLLEVEF